MAYESEDRLGSFSFSSRICGPWQACGDQRATFCGVLSVTSLWALGTVLGSPECCPLSQLLNAFHGEVVTLETVLNNRQA